VGGGGGGGFGGGGWGGAVTESRRRDLLIQVLDARGERGTSPWGFSMLGLMRIRKVTWAARSEFY